MGSWDKETGVVDSSAGTIVWVRRRNGSWWPGKILRPEELSDAHLMSPRSGTPVKLLGREDASVDWYNLDKSKRVKAFRCGEFDDCIGRAESSLGMPPKKREKYARREDAILHALELEKKLLEEKYGKLGRSCNGKSSDQVEKTSVAPSECLGNESGKHAHPKSHSKEPDSAIEDKSMDHPLHEEKVKEGNLLLGDEDNSEILPRMRGLQDIVLKTSHAQQELSSITLNGFLKPEFDSNAHSLPGGCPATEDEVLTNSKTSLDRRKRSHEIWTDESLVRRRDKRRPLVQVLQNSAKLPVHHSLQHDSDNVSVLMSGEEQTAVIHHAKRSRRVDLPGKSSEWSDDKQFCPNRMVIPPPQFEENKSPHPAALGEEFASESSENTETDSSEADSHDSDADEEILALSDAALVSKLEPRCLSGTQVQHGSMSCEEPDELVLANEVSHLPPCDPFSTCMGVSKWQLKGKRNNRGVAKRSTDLTDRTVFRGSMYGANLEGRESNACGEPDLIENDFRTRIGAFDNREYLSSKFTTKGLDDFTHNIIDREDLPWNDQPVPRGYWEEDSSNYFDPVFEGRHCFGGRMKSMLVDVELKVQSSYQREHVPMISLMSKFKGQAIVGHPIQIEALENGSSEILLSAADGIFPETSDNDTALPPVWRTARRTAKFRLPHPHSSATLDGGETMERFHYADQEKKVLSKKSNVWRYDHKVTRPPLNRKFSRKPPKKISLSSSQKTKTLSSIGTERKLSNDFRHGTGNSPVNGLIKGESGPTAVACIPVKLVYSRLYEELVGRRP